MALVSALTCSWALRGEPSKVNHFPKFLVHRSPQVLTAGASLRVKQFLKSYFSGELSGELMLATVYLSFF